MRMCDLLVRYACTILVTKRASQTLYMEKSKYTWGVRVVMEHDLGFLGIIPVLHIQIRDQNQFYHLKMYRSALLLVHASAWYISKHDGSQVVCSGLWKLSEFRNIDKPIENVPRWENYADWWVKGDVSLCIEPSGAVETWSDCIFLKPRNVKNLSPVYSLLSQKSIVSFG